MGESFKVSVVIAKDPAGSENGTVLGERRSPLSELVPVASERGHGKRVVSARQQLSAANAEATVLSGIDIALMPTRERPSRQLAPVSDSMAEGAATNAAQPAEPLTRDHPSAVRGRRRIP